MSKFQVGQEVRCITDHFSYVHKGNIYTVAAVHNKGRIRLKGINAPYSVSFFEAVEYPPAEHVPEIDQLLSAMEVTQAAIDDVPVECFCAGHRNRADHWVKVEPRILSLDTILKGKFRKYIERIEIHGVEVVKPTIDTTEQDVDTNRLRYSININLRDVIKNKG